MGRLLGLLEVYAGIGLILYHQEVGGYLLQYLPSTGQPLVDSLLQSAATTVFPIFGGAYLIYDAGRRNKVW